MKINGHDRAPSPCSEMLLRSVTPVSPRCAPRIPAIDVLRSPLPPPTTPVGTGPGGPAEAAQQTAVTPRPRGRSPVGRAAANRGRLASDSSESPVPRSPPRGPRRMGAPIPFPRLLPHGFPDDFSLAAVAPPVAWAARGDAAGRGQGDLGGRGPAAPPPGARGNGGGSARREASTVRSPSFGGGVRAAPRGLDSSSTTTGGSSRATVIQNHQFDVTARAALSPAATLCGRNIVVAGRLSAVPEIAAAASPDESATLNPALFEGVNPYLASGHEGPFGHEGGILGPHGVMEGDSGAVAADAFPPLPYSGFGGVLFQRMMSRAG